MRSVNEYDTQCRNTVARTIVILSIHHGKLLDDLLIIRRGVPRVRVLGAPSIHVRRDDLLVLLVQLYGLR